MNRFNAVREKMNHLLKFEPFERDVSIGVFIFLRFCIIKSVPHLLSQM